MSPENTIEACPDAGQQDLRGLLDVDKVTKVIGAVTPFIIVLISIGTMYTIFTAQPDFARW